MDPQLGGSTKSLSKHLAYFIKLISGLVGYQRRLVSKPASPLLPTAEAICESEASKCAPMAPPSMYCFAFVMHAFTLLIRWLVTSTTLA